jgi:hypothetical protein
MRETCRTAVLLTLFALAMAQVEASVVMHLRSLYYPQQPLRVFPLVLLSHHDLAIELLREAATLVMFLCVVLLAVRDPGRRFAAFCYVFGLWDLGYYLWLELMIGWPVQWLEWDVLFLLPWPWFGPWLAAALIALLLVAWGGWLLFTGRQPGFSRASLLQFATGCLVALATFLWSALPLLTAGEQAFAGYRPGDFPWLIYVVGYLLMAQGLWRALIDRSDAGAEHTHV